MCPPGKLNYGTGYESPFGEEAACDECPFAERCEGGATCAPSFAGPLCAKCESNHFPMNDLCNKCPAVPWGLIAMCGMVALAALGLAHFDLTHWTFAAAFKQLFVFAQNCNIVELIHVAWPDEYKNIMMSFTLHSLSLDMTAPECISEGVTWHTKPVEFLQSPCSD